MLESEDSGTSGGGKVMSEFELGKDKLAAATGTTELEVDGWLMKAVVVVEVKDELVPIIEDVEFN